jgi:LmbE family N-acetylglucosaminyl deacetylase
MDDRPNLILSPHFDDAVLSLGGLIATAPERAVVVTVFSGTPPAENIAGRWDRRSGFASAAAAMRARAVENERALAVLGVAPDAIRNLGHLDSQYRVQRQSDRVAIAELRSAIAADIRRLVRDHGGAVNLFAPASAWHPDHRIVGDAVFDFHRMDDGPAADVFLYQDQPYAYLELRRRSLAPLRLVNFSRLAGVAAQRSGVVVTGEFIEFDERQRQAKTEAIEQYGSQFRILRPLLGKMISDFSYYQARAGRQASRYAEMVYRLPSGPGLA